MLPLLLICVVAVVLTAAGCGGVMVYLAKKGKFGVGGAAAPVEEKTPEAATTHPVVLEPLLVNLADEDGHSYLRVSIVLSELDAPAKDKTKKEGEAAAKPVPGAEAALRDTILDVLGKQHAAVLLDPAGKDHLKQDLKDALDKNVPDAKIQAVYFTDFLVQR